MKALIIDDSRAMRRMLSAFVVKHAHAEAVEAEDGLYALEALERHAPFDFALVDWDMPRMDGMEFVRAVRADRRWDDLKLMMVTARNDGDDLLKALEEGANDFLMKPLSENMVVEKLRILGLVD
jgi:two-component system chemotaxis response regulator CheY